MWNTTTYTYNDLDQLVTEDDSTLYTYTYDANGNQTKKSWSGGEQNYLYDSRNRLKRVYDGAVQGDPDIAYAYDYAQNRVARAVPATGETVHFLIDENNLTGYSQTLLEVEDTGQVAAKRYDFADDLLTQIKDPTSPVASTSHLLYDALGSTRSLTTDAGTLGESYNYTPFGTPLDFSLGSSTTPHLFAGEWFDAGTGYSYNRARWYDTGTGRFTATDPVEDAINFYHRFNYVSGNPINAIDASGTFTLLEIQLVQAIVSILVDLQVEAGETSVSKSLGAQAAEEVRQVFMGVIVLGYISGGMGLAKVGWSGIRNLPRVTRLFAKGSFRLAVGAGRKLIRASGKFGNALDVAHLPKKRGFEHIVRDEWYIRVVWPKQPWEKIFMEANGGIKVKGGTIHHLIPQEFYGPGKLFDLAKRDVPTNLVSVSNDVHKEISAMWKQFKKEFPKSHDRPMNAEDVVAFHESVVAQYKNYFWGPAAGFGLPPGSAGFIPQF